MSTTTFITLALAATQAFSLALPVQKRSSPYPFQQLVAFGDELSDNGNGSYAHGITGDPGSMDKVYGSGTWTDGPVAVSYLADLLQVPLVDYAFGTSGGGGVLGAVMDNDYTKDGVAQVNGKNVPSMIDQVNNYTSSPNNNAENSIAFLWFGQNDVTKHTDAFWEGDAQNAAFAKEYATRVTAQAEKLVNAGVKYVFVANIYPKNLAPVTKTYLCPDGKCVDAWGRVINQANTALKNALSASSHADKFIYYDANKAFTLLIQTKNYWGLTAPLDQFCDGGDGNQWNTCIGGSYVWQGAQKFFWMNYVQATTTVYSFIANNMRTQIDMFFAGQH